MLKDDPGSYGGGGGVSMGRNVKEQKQNKVNELIRLLLSSIK